MRFLKKREVAQRVGYHPVHIMRLVSNHKFPQPVRLNNHTVAFLEEEDRIGNGKTNGCQLHCGRI